MRNSAAGESDLPTLKILIWVSCAERGKRPGISFKIGIPNSVKCSGQAGRRELVAKVLGGVNRLILPCVAPAYSAVVRPGGIPPMPRHSARGLGNPPAGAFTFRVKA
jgi:hypothetical protein